MRTTLLLSLLAAGAVTLSAQAPAPKPTTPGATTPAPRPATPGTTTPAPRPAPQQPTTPRRPVVTARSGMAITVTTPAGATIDNVRVEILGPTDRGATTNASGQVNFPGLQAGTYRLRFSGEEVTTFEREVTLRAGQIADLDIMLNAAPPPREVPAPPAPVEPAPAPEPEVGPAGQPQAVAVAAVLRQQRLTDKDPRVESLLSCSGNARTMLIQLNAALPDRLYDTGEATYYVVGGQGTARVNGRDTNVETGSFVSVPRGTSHSFTRRGREGLVLLQTLSGAPCEQIK